MDSPAGKTIVSSDNMFVYRRCDTGFSTKWTGVWSPPYKMLDYFSFRINGEWLSEDNMTSLDYRESSIRKFSLDTLDVSQKVEPVRSGIEISVEVQNPAKTPVAMSAGMEYAVDIRHQSQDIGPESYQYTEHDHSLEFKSDSKSLEVKGDFTELRGKEQIIEHFPGQRQRALRPRNLGWSRSLGPGETASLKTRLLTGNSSDRENTTFLTPGTGENRFLTELKKLWFSSNGGGFCAGFPWFQSFWARDSFWTAIALAEAGEPDLAHRALLNFADKGLPSRIPVRSSEKVSRHDTYPLFIIAADRVSQKMQLDSTIKKAQENAFSKLQIQGNLVQHKPEATWMDTIERSPAVEMQSLWLQACESMERERAAEKLKQGLQAFVEDGKVYDTTSKSRITCNCALPIKFNQLPQNQVSSALDRINADLISSHGARTMSPANSCYSDAAYHEGSVWGLSTWWLADANLVQGRRTTGRAVLQNFLESRQTGALGSLPENIDADTGELLGATSQAWSLAGALHLSNKHGLDI